MALTSFATRAVLDQGKVPYYGTPPPSAPSPTASCCGRPRRSDRDRGKVPYYARTTRQPLPTCGCAPIKPRGARRSRQASIRAGPRSIRPPRRVPLQAASRIRVSRPADAKADAPRTPTPEQAQRNSAPAAKHAARPAIPAGAATTPARAVRPTPTSAPPPSTQKETARRAATGAKPTSAATPASKSCASGRAISAAVRRHVWQRDGGRLQLRRSTDRAPLQLNASDRDRPHRPACAGRRRRSREPQTSVWRAHHRHRHAQGRSSREPAPRDLAP